MKYLSATLESSSLKTSFPTCTLLCQALDVSQSEYYAWKQRGTSKHRREYAQLAADIQEIFVEHREVYGSPHVLVVLQERGWKTSRKRVAGLMRQLGLSAQTHRSRKPTTKSDPMLALLPIRSIGSSAQVGWAISSRASISTTTLLKTPDRERTWTTIPSRLL